MVFLFLCFVFVLKEQSAGQINIDMPFTQAMLSTLWLQYHGLHKCNTSTLQASTTSYFSYEKVTGKRKDLFQTLTLYFLFYIVVPHRFLSIADAMILPCWPATT